MSTTGGIRTSAVPPSAFMVTVADCSIGCASEATVTEAAEKRHPGHEGICGLTREGHAVRMSSRSGRGAVPAIYGPDVGTGVATVVQSGGPALSARPAYLDLGELGSKSYARRKNIKAQALRL